MSSGDRNKNFRANIRRLINEGQRYIDIFNLYAEKKPIPKVSIDEMHAWYNESRAIAESVGMTIPAEEKSFEHRVGWEGPVDAITRRTFQALINIQSLAIPGPEGKKLEPEKRSLKKEHRDQGEKKVFLGYAGKSEALALRISRFLTQECSGIEVIDWQLHFEPGTVLIGNLFDVADSVDYAIMVATKDDISSTVSSTNIFTPRDNIIFEIGLFMGVIGMKNVIIIKEEGVSLPSDWGGILYLGVRDQTSIDAIKVQICRKLGCNLRVF